MISILISDDILLRTYQQDDTAELFHAIDSSRKHLRTWLNWVDMTTKLEHSETFIQNALVNYAAQHSISLGIFKDRRIIGGISFYDWEHQLRKGEIGYWITKEYEGKGIVTVSVSRFLDFVFEKLHLNKVELRFMPQNTRSAMVAERLGAKVEGIIRQSYSHNGGLEDVVVTGILKTEWLANPNRVIALKADRAIAG